MDKILIQRVSLDGLSSSLLDTSAFQKNISDTEIYLNKLKDILLAARIDATTMPFCPYLKARLDKDASCTIYNGPFDHYISTLSLDAIDELLTHNNTIAAVLVDGIDTKSIDAVHGKHIYIGMATRTDVVGVLMKYTLIRPNACIKCNELINNTTIEDHQKSIGCHDTELENTIKANQFEQIQEDDESQIIRTKNIPYKYYPIGFNIFVPKWVTQAIQMYVSMRSRGGFQDIQLSEYLDKMAETER